MIRFRISAVTLLVALTVLAGCSDQGTAPQVAGGGGGESDVSFAADIQPIFNANCIGCHGAGGNGGLDLRDGSSYGNLVGVEAMGYSLLRVEAGSSETSVLYLKLMGAPVTGTRMPVGGTLEQATIDLVADWIDQGARNN
ncbi:hypothetical protein CO151_13880 [bacterium CG_4_9_14_3_um_filter_65_15]|nr:MAG: hypothetical protein CO151_13880 [bacterium CG_4_9_14_3_um_filter_65_15]